MYRTPWHCVNKCRTYSCYLLMPKFHYIYLAQNPLKTRSPTCFEQKKSRGPGLRPKKSHTCRCPNSIIYLAQNLLKTRSPTCFEQKKSRGPGLRQDRSISTCRYRSSDKFSTNKKVADLVSDKIDLMEFGLNRTVSLQRVINVLRWIVLSHCIYSK